MVVDERARHKLFGRLEHVLGAEYAVTLMEHLPPVDWTDIATKHDLSAMKHEIIAMMRAELANALTAQTRTIVFAMLGALTSMAAMVFAAARFSMG
ncbi:MAG: hypothetical protein ACRDYA_13170 [Egibacteraceae bacterium]